MQSLWIYLASAAPPAKKVNHERAPERFSCRLRPKWRVEPSLPQTILERRTANPRKYGQRQAQERDANSGIVNDLVTGCLSWKLIESCASHRSPILEKSWNKC